MEHISHKLVHSEVFVLNCGPWVDHAQHITGTKHSAMSLHKGRVQENIPRLSRMKWGPGTQPLLQFNKPTAHSQNVLKDFLSYYSLWIPCSPWCTRLICINFNEFYPHIKRGWPTYVGSFHMLSFSGNKMPQEYSYIGKIAKVFLNIFP